MLGCIEQLNIFVLKSNWQHMLFKVAETQSHYGIWKDLDFIPYADLTKCWTSSLFRHDWDYRQRRLYKLYRPSVPISYVYISMNNVCLQKWKRSVANVDNTLKRLSSIIFFTTGSQIVNQLSHHTQLLHIITVQNRCDKHVSKQQTKHSHHLYIIVCGEKYRFERL